MTKIKIGTRGSLLALAHANIVRNKILDTNKNLSIDDIELVIITTSGDRIQNRSLSEIGGKGLFVKEIEEAMLNNEIDIAVHSMKDMPAIITEGLTINCFLEREDPRDAFLSVGNRPIEELKACSVIGTSSARRKAQLIAIRPDLEIVNFRGNVTTRMEKLASGIVDGTFLAVAGLKRINISSELYLPMSVELMLPAIAQGIIGVQTRENDIITQEIIAKLNHTETEICVRAERTFLEKLDASCTTPLAALATIEGDQLTLKAEILKPDGSIVYKTSLIGTLDEAVKLGAKAAEELLAKGGKDFFK
ncbi:MAG: hydroxymethylbilane synthase [Alphaproteobacteria bacterium]